MTETRLKKITEFIEGINTIKFMAWEEVLYAQIDKIRKKESSYTYKIFKATSQVFLILGVIPMLCALLSIWLHERIYGEL